MGDQDGLFKERDIDSDTNGWGKAIVVVVASLILIVGLVAIVSTVIVYASSHPEFLTWLLPGDPLH